MATIKRSTYPLFSSWQLPTAILALLMFAPHAQAQMSINVNIKNSTSSPVTTHVESSGSGMSFGSLKTLMIPPNSNAQTTVQSSGDPDMDASSHWFQLWFGTTNLVSFGLTEVVLDSVDPTDGGYSCAASGSYFPYPCIKSPNPSCQNVSLSCTKTDTTSVYGISRQYCSQADLTIDILKAC